MKRIFFAAVVFLISNIALALPQDKNAQIPSDTPEPEFLMIGKLDLDTSTLDAQESNTSTLDTQENNTGTR
jgi:hypothetical protein